MLDVSLKSEDLPFLVFIPAFRVQNSVVSASWLVMGGLCWFCSLLCIQKRQKNKPNKRPVPSGPERAETPGPRLSPADRKPVRLSVVIAALEWHKPQQPRDERPCLSSAPVCGRGALTWCKHAPNPGTESESSGRKTTSESVSMEPANKHWTILCLCVRVHVLVSLHAEDEGEKSDPYCLRMSTPALNLAPFQRLSVLNFQEVPQFVLKPASSDRISGRIYIQTKLHVDSAIRYKNCFQENQMIFTMQ